MEKVLIAFYDPYGNDVLRKNLEHNSEVVKGILQESGKLPKDVYPVITITFPFKGFGKILETIDGEEFDKVILVTALATQHDDYGLSVLEKQIVDERKLPLAVAKVSSDTGILVSVTYVDPGSNEHGKFYHVCTKFTEENAKYYPLTHLQIRKGSTDFAEDLELGHWGQYTYALPEDKIIYPTLEDGVLVYRGEINLKGEYLPGKQFQDKIIEPLHPQENLIINFILRMKQEGGSIWKSSEATGTDPSITIPLFITKRA